MRWEPIHPSQSAAATGLGEVEPAVLQEDSKYTGISVNAYNFDLATMVELGFSDFINTKTNVDVHYLMLEIAVYEPGLYKVKYNDGTISFERKGIGIRVGVACWGVSFAASSNFAKVSASVSVKSAGSKIGIYAIGGEAFNNLGIFHEVKKNPVLSPDMMREIGKASEQVVDLLVTDNTLTPESMRVASLDIAKEGLYAAALTMQFANEQVYRKNSLAEAAAVLAKREPDKMRYFHPMVARAAYAGYGIDNDGRIPSREQSDEAHKILMTGR